MGRPMNSDKDELKKYLKVSSIDADFDKNEIGLELKTNFETLEEGRFPEKLLDEVRNSDTFGNSEIMKEIEMNHTKILENRPIPELLDTADLINNLDDLNLTNDEILELILQHPKLLQRPVFVFNNKAIIGRPPENVLKII